MGYVNPDKSLNLAGPEIFQLLNERGYRAIWWSEPLSQSPSGSYRKKSSQRQMEEASEFCWQWKKSAIKREDARNAEGPHATHSPVSTKSTFYHTTCQLRTFEFFLILIHRALPSLASLCIFAPSNHFISRDLQCGPRKWQHFRCRKAQSEHSWGRLQSCFQFT